MTKKHKRCPECGGQIINPAWFGGKEICQKCWYRIKNRESHFKRGRPFLDVIVKS